MEQSSTEFGKLILTHHQRLSRVVIFNAGQIVEDTYYGGTKFQLQCDSSSVSYDRTQDTRTTAQISLVQQQLGVDGLVDPIYYPEVEIYCGVMTSVGPEWIIMGTLGVTDDKVTRNGTLVTHELNCVDRSSRVRDNPNKNVVKFDKGTDYFTAMRTLLNSQAKGFTPIYNHGTSTYTMPDTIVDEDADVWADVMAYAEAVQCETYFDRRGVHIAQPIPDAAKLAPVLRFSATDFGILINPITRTASNREVFNGVICKAEAPWLLFPVKGEIWDDDPLSPTNRTTFGEKPKKIGDAIATTAAQCQATATAEWNKIKGVVEVIDFGLICDPRLDVGDVFELIDTNLNITGRYVLDNYKFNLGPNTATGQVRRRK